MSTLESALRIPDELGPWVEAGVVEARDLRAVSSIMSLAGVPRDADPLVWIALALVLATPRSGHTCVDLSRMEMWAPAEGTDVVFDWPLNADLWTSALRAVPVLVGAPDDADSSLRRPFVLWGNRLYAARSFAEEKSVARLLSAAIVEGRLSVVTGGPGSGKTTHVAQLIVDHVKATNGSDTIALAAPTGLAAKRMDRALRAAVRDGIKKGTVSVEMEKIVDSLPKFTVHKLLKFNPSARMQWGFNAANNMSYDIVIIDEVSMMPLSMMARVLQAMPPTGRLVLVGDPFQLASVDAGTVLADIVEASERGRTFVQAMPGMYRFPEGSPVADIAARTKEGDVTGALAAVNQHNGSTGSARFSWVDPATNDAGLQAVARSVVEHARDLCGLALQATSDADYRRVLEFRDSVQVVCAHRRGNLGVSGWNTAVERQLGHLARGQWYPGRPVMVTKNDPYSRLSNGDIGVVCRDANGSPVVVFGDSEEVRVLPVSRVPRVETVHALTIHKSQGSEFAHTIVVLPKKKSRILTRELLYTGMTRAKPHLTLVATVEALESAVGTKVQRATGLSDQF